MKIVCPFRSYFMIKKSNFCYHNHRNKIGVNQLKLTRHNRTTRTIFHYILSVQKRKFRMSEVLTVPESIVCSICSEVCKRGVKVDCCSAIACRSCATRSVTRNKTCWNGACAKQIKTGDLINDETLREEVDKYQTVRKEAEGKIKAEQEAKEKAEREAVEEEKEGTTKKGCRVQQ
eukprot:GFUD01042407.1.p1 GENE.GFUD01042407.1~~GFUD01042407.1.p1  ORF type:complete len:175 (-),score=39.37 GFUD01042407.1:215-739(-)